MRAVVPAGSTRSLAVTVVGVMALLCGVGYLVLGGQLILAVAGWFAQATPDPSKQVLAPIAVLAAPVLVLFGVLFLVLGILDLVAAFGVFLRKPWGRILTFVMAALAVVFGLLWLSGVRDVTQDATDLAIGVVQILYAIVAILVLTVKGGEFESRLARPSEQVRG
jgi:hypothetical protein